MVEKTMSSRFKFVGELFVPKATSKRPMVQEREIKESKTSTKTRPALSVTFGVKADDNNMAFVEAFGSEQSVIKTMSVDNEKIEIDWADRFDESVVQTVAGYKKYVVNLGEYFGGRQEFVSQYDQLQYLKEHLPGFKGKVTVTGQYTKEWYEGKNGGQYYDHFKLQNVYAADEAEKGRLSLVMDIYYDKDSVDVADWKEKKKIYVNGYIPQYINKNEGTKFVPQQFVFSGEKYDPENEKHQRILKYKLSYVQTKSKTMVHIPWDIVLLRGAESADFDASMLTDKQKEQLELGLKTLDDFKPRGNIVGGKINEFRLYDPQLVGDFADGLVDTELSDEEFEKDIFVPIQDEKLDDVLKNAKKTSDVGTETQEAADSIVDEEELF